MSRARLAVGNMAPGLRAGASDAAIMEIKFAPALRAFCSIFTCRICADRPTVEIHRSEFKERNMRHFTLAGLALAAAVTLSLGAAQAAPAGGGSGGLASDGHGMCRQFNGNSNNLIFSYWDKCPGHEQRKGGTGVRTIRVTRAHAKKEG
jgi:hypothetical protein